MATAADESYLLPVYTNTNPGVEQVRSRQCIPILHVYAVKALNAYTAGRLTWRSLWVMVRVAISRDQVQLVHYQGFLDYVQVCSNHRAQATNRVQPPPTVHPNPKWT
jgi:hypothetical protein